MEDILDFIEESDMWQEPYVDILKKAPQTTIDDAYDLQFATMKRKIAKGDRIIGYKAAGTTRSAQTLLGEQPYPIIGTLLASQLLEEDAVYDLRPGTTYVEAEICIALKKDLSGPDITYYEVLDAIDYYVPAMEISPWSPAAMNKERSFQQVIATQKLNGKIVLGRNKVSPSQIDLRYEGAVVHVDGEIVATGTGAEVMGDPVTCLLAILRRLFRHGVEVKAGMMFMTGSVARPHPGALGMRNARIGFTRLGSVAVNFTDAD